MDEEVNKGEISKNEKHTNQPEMVRRMILGFSFVKKETIFMTIAVFSVFVIFFIYFYQNELISDQYESRIRKYLLPKSEADEIINLAQKKELFCLIKTTPGALKSNKTLTTFKVWASRCSNYRFITLIPEDKLSTAVTYGNHTEISTPFYLTQPEGLKTEVYGKITDKLYSAIRYVYSRFNDYKWYWIYF
jgi:hypothetical protein